MRSKNVFKLLCLVLFSFLLFGCSTKVENEITTTRSENKEESNNQNVTFTNSVDEIYNNVFKMDTHLHVDVPMEKENMPWNEMVDLKEAMNKAGLNAIGGTFAVDYIRLKYEGHAFERFKNAIDSTDKILNDSGMKRALNYDEVMDTYKKGEPVFIQAVEGGHFLEGDISRIQYAYDKGLRIFCLLHDNDATPPLGDVYTNEPKFGGLTELGAETIKECERLGILVDLAHCDDNTVKMALDIATKPLVISHTGPKIDGELTGMAAMMSKRLINKETAKLVADKGGVVGIWPHLANSAKEYVDNIKKVVDWIGVDHVCIGTDTKITTEISEWEDWNDDGENKKDENREEKKEFKNDDNKQAGFGSKDANAINHVWSDDEDNFYKSVIRELVNVGFNEEEIGKITGGNFLRVFKEATK